jgi:hypothetical protein
MERFLFICSCLPPSVRNGGQLISSDQELLSNFAALNSYDVNQGDKSGYSTDVVYKESPRKSEQSD